ncbi:cytochrome P450 27C1-like isoform X1 [Biomphalaria pfeifferi]|uniref:Cytochrome P450 27C1-like isoform X1 n=1 Tax=Biomphalaria pfeifferi TaxID=112525 RepID=A0AAD8AP62_BIOPF|nr:cytochrome P450 27C1-like isoform X1 [Biomphalaria pfeifferi]
MKAIRLTLCQLCHNDVWGNLIPIRLLSSVTQMHEGQVKVRPFSEMPGPKGIYQWPVIGTVLHYKPFTKHTPEKIHRLMNELFDKYGPVVKFRMGPQTVAVCDPKDFETVFRNEGQYPVRPTLDIVTAYNKRNGHKETFAQLQGEEWHARRTPLNKRLVRSDSASYYLEQQSQVAEDLVRALAKEDLTAEDFQDLFYRYASESIFLVAFNRRLGLFKEEPDKISVDFVQAAKTSTQMLQDALLGKLFMTKWLKNSSYKKFESLLNFQKKVTADCVMEARKVLEDRIKSGDFKADEPNLLFSLLSEINMTDEDINDAVGTLYAAGTESTAKNLQTFFYTLALNPEKQEILRQEILNILGANGILTAQALSQMAYLKAALKESFRLYPPAAVGIIRVLPVDVTLGQYAVPAGTQIIMFSPRPSKTQFENPNQFLPERWLRSGESVNKDTSLGFIVLPFGHGPRNCIGRRFATQEMYLATTKVLQNFKIDVAPESKSTQFIYKMFIEPEEPIKFKFTKLH